MKVELRLQNRAGLIFCRGLGLYVVIKRHASRTDLVQFFTIISQKYKARLPFNFRAVSWETVTCLLKFKC